jgi:predicted nucleotidyltransferase
MDVPGIDRAILRLHIAAIEARYPIKIVGLLPRGSAAHAIGDDALDLLADKLPGLTLLGLAGAEIDLGQQLGRPVGIVLRTALRKQEAEELPRIMQPI